jgi:hypothetical protein
MSEALQTYRTIPAPPADTPGGAAVVARIVDGLAFRYRWAVDGLQPDDLDFRPCDGSMTLGELLDHLRYLARWMGTNVAAARAGTEPVTYPACCDDLSDLSDDAAPRLEQLVDQTLVALTALRDDILALGESGLARVVLIGGKEPTPFPVWHMFNGPLADSLTHVGQLTSWRRMLGRPVPRHDVFRGRPPKDG